MAGRGAPSFLKRQKEQARAARALAKRQAKQARREDRAAAGKQEDGIEDMVPLDAPNQDTDLDDPPAE